jgi:hypothetical protein
LLEGDPIKISNGAGQRVGVEKCLFAYATHLSSVRPAASTGVGQYSPAPMMNSASSRAIEKSLTPACLQRNYFTDWANCSDMACAVVLTVPPGDNLQ